jgi:hypothetical protein
VQRSTTVLARPPFGVSDDFGEQARTVEVDTRVQVLV